MDKETREFRGRKVRTIKPSILKRVNVLTRAATFFSIERSHDAIFEETPIHRFVTAFNLYKSMEERERGGGDVFEVHARKLARPRYRKNSFSVIPLTLNFSSDRSNLSVKEKAEIDRRRRGPRIKLLGICSMRKR